MQLGLPFSDQDDRGNSVVSSTDAPDPALGGDLGDALARSSARGWVHSSPPETPLGPGARDTLSSPPPGLHGRVIYARRRRARRYVLRVDEDGCVRVTIPRGGTRRDAADFVARHLEWIARRQDRVGRGAIPADARPGLEARARAFLPARLLDLARQHGLTVARVSIRDQRTRWGSCGPNGHICLNWRLICLPDWVRDYVLVHELMHLRRLDHSPAYWALVASACPGYRDARRWLHEHGPPLR